MSTTDDDDDDKKKYFRIYIETLYSLNKDKHQLANLKAALDGLARDDESAKEFATNISEAIKAKEENNDDKYDDIIKSVTSDSKYDLNGDHKKLRDYLNSHWANKVTFQGLIPALEEWKQDKDLTIDEDKLSKAILDGNNADLTQLNAKEKALFRLTNLDQKYEGSPLQDELKQIADAYATAKTDADFEKLAELRKAMPMDKDHIEMMFAIRNAICYEDGTTKSHPRGKLPRNVPMEIVPTGEERQLTDEYQTQFLNSYNSDEWNQLMTAAGNTAVVEGAELTMGIATQALLEVLGEKDFDPEKFGAMTLNEQEQFMKSLSPAQRTKFNIAVAAKSQKLAEMLPPNMLVVMAEGTEKSLADPKASDAEKDVLQEQLKILQDTMRHTVSTYHDGGIDISNVAGVYDGMKLMLAYLENNNQASDLAEKIAQIRHDLEASIKQYDEANGLTKVDKNSAQKIEKSYDTLSKEVSEILGKGKNSEDFLDPDTKELLSNIEFPETTDEKGNKVSAEENKKLFIEQILYQAAQITACGHAGDDDKKLKEAFKVQIAETAMKESMALMSGAIIAEGLDPDLIAKLKDSNVSEDDKRQAIAAYYDNRCHNGEKIKVSQEVFAGYMAGSVNRQSLFLNRLANKMPNRCASVLQKMWKPFAKLDKTCIQRFGQPYVKTKQILFSQLKNAPWTALNAAARITAFSIGGPWAIGAYAGFNVAMATTRHILNYRKIKKQNPEMTVGKYLKQNWSGMLLTGVGTAVSVIPGLAGAGVGGLDGIMGTATAWHAFDHHAALSNASLTMMGLGMADSVVRGTISARKQGASFGKALALSAFSSTVATAAGIGMSMGVSAGVNNLSAAGAHLFGAELHGGLNQVGDSRDLGDTTEKVPADDIKARLTNTEDATKYDNLTKELNTGELSHEQSDAKLEELKDLLGQNGISIDTDNEHGDIVQKYSTDQNTQESIDSSQKTVERWTSNAPEVREANLKTLTPIVEEYNKAHPDAPIDVYRVYHTMLLMGAQAVNAHVDTHYLHLDNHAPVPAGGNYGCTGEDYIQEHGKAIGITNDDVKAVKGAADANGVMNGEAVKNNLDAIVKMEQVVGTHGTVGDTKGTYGQEIHQVLKFQATADASGRHVETKDNATFFHTYADGKPAHEQVEHEVKYSATEQVSHIIEMPMYWASAIYSSARKMWLSQVEGQNAKNTKEDSKNGQEIFGQMGRGYQPGAPNSQTTTNNDKGSWLQRNILNRFKSLNKE